MRLSRRASQTPCIQTPSLPGPKCQHCEINLTLFPAYISCADRQCHGLPLCFPCFSVGAHDVKPHESTHPYRIVELCGENVYSSDWAAHEEQRLLHAMCQHGPYHWESIADYVKTKSAASCEKHYRQVYLNKDTAPLPKNISNDPVDDSMLAASAIEVKRARDDYAKKEANRKASMRKTGVFVGFDEKRNDFDIEWDNDAEDAIANLSIGLDDTKEEIDQKCSQLAAFDKRLKVRDAVKYILLNHDLLDLGPCPKRGPKASRANRELKSRLRKFVKLLEQRSNGSLQPPRKPPSSSRRRSRKKTLSGCRKLSRKAPRESAVATSPIIGRRRRRSVLEDLPTYPKRMRKNDDTPSSVRSGKRDGSPPILSCDLTENLHLVYAPTAQVDGLPAGVDTQAVFEGEYLPPPEHLEKEKGTSCDALSRNGVNLNGEELSPLLQSTTSVLEDVRLMPRASELNENELSICSSIQLPPDDFLVIKGALLDAFKEPVHPSTPSDSDEDEDGSLQGSIDFHSLADLNLPDEVFLTHMPLRKSRSTSTHGSESIGEKVKRKTMRRGRRSKKQESHIAQKDSTFTSRKAMRTGSIRLSGESTQALPFLASVERADEVSRHRMDKTMYTRNHTATRYVETRTAASNNKKMQLNEKLFSTNSNPFQTRNGNTQFSASGRSANGLDHSADIIAQAEGASGSRLMLSLRLPDEPSAHSDFARKNDKVCISIHIALENDKERVASDITENNKDTDQKTENQALTTSARWSCARNVAKTTSELEASGPGRTPKSGRSSRRVQRIPRRSGKARRKDWGEHTEGRCSPEERSFPLEETAKSIIPQHCEGETKARQFITIDSALGNQGTCISKDEALSAPQTEVTEALTTGIQTQLSSTTLKNASHEAKRAPGMLVEGVEEEVLDGGDISTLLKEKYDGSSLCNVNDDASKKPKDPVSQQEVPLIHNSANEQKSGFEIDYSVDSSKVASPSLLTGAAHVESIRIDGVAVFHENSPAPTHPQMQTDEPDSEEDSSSDEDDENDPSVSFPMEEASEDDEESLDAVPERRKKGRRRKMKTHQRGRRKRTRRN